jgi:hypothetical protein
VIPNLMGARKFSKPRPQAESFDLDSDRDL